MQATAPSAATYRPETTVVAVGTTGNESAASAVSWAAIIAGAFAAAAMGLILIALGTGLGFAAVSPWSNSGASATAIGVAGAIWLLLMSAIASAIGGYLAGRLRTRWVDVHGDEVFFRDTAHGFLAWAVGTVLTAALLTSAAGALVGGTAKVAGAGAPVAATGAAGMAASNVAQQPRPIAPTDPNAYFVDSLFRSPTEATAAENAATRAEVGRIFAHGMRSGDIPPSDRLYLSQLVAARTGLSPQDADKRVNDVYSRAQATAAEADARAREAADAARKAATYTSLWMFIAMLVGAFSATYFATLGGRLRDDLRA
ncbi:MAG TPA: hypothetical protein VGK37_12520 [Casimicrobiaceae bacterium]|jgi:hypothetical protein